MNSVLTVIDGKKCFWVEAIFNIAPLKLNGPMMML
jgi:hypothetical protein